MDTNSVVLQAPPEFDKCVGLLDGLCVLQQVVEKFLNARQFHNPQLAPLLPCDFEFVIGNAETSVPAEFATPDITMRRSDLQLNPIAPRPLNNFGASVSQPTFSVDFEIRSAYYKLSEMLTLELGQFLTTFAPYMRQFNINIGSIVCGSVQRQRENTPDFYFSKVTVNAALPLTAWPYPIIGDILRSVSINVTIQGGAGNATAQLI